DRLGEGTERLVHAGPGLGGCEKLRGGVNRPHPGKLFLADHESLGQVHLVPEEDHGHVAHLLPDHLDPVVQIVERVFAREVADRDIPDEADLGLEMLLAGHRGGRHHASPIERGLMYREHASIAPDNSYSSGSTFRAYRSFATRSARDWNAFSTLTPALADVKW